MFQNIIGAGTQALNSIGYGVVVPSPDALRPMTEAQMQEFMRRQGNPQNVGLSLATLQGMQNAAYRRYERKPTMTLEEFDARLAKFKSTRSQTPSQHSDKE